MKNIANVDDIKVAIKSAMSSKIIGYEEFLSDIVSKACLKTLPDDPS